jgi:hypothetical protein
MQVPQERLNKILEIYKPDLRYLVEANVGYPKAEGKFRVSGEAYTTEKLEHMTIIDATAGLNQLCYSAFGEWLLEGRFGEAMPFERFLKLMKENSFAIDAHIRFRKKIPINREIYGQVEFVKMKRHGGLSLAFLNYDLEQGSSKGCLELAGVF